ncbi:hypothetical protein QFZ51_002727 [Chitinophaga sp. W3I9]
MFYTTAVTKQPIHYGNFLLHNPAERKSLFDFM